jgi:hypothetical protein
MPLLPNNPGGRACVSAAVAVLSLGLAGLSSGQVMNAKLPEPAKKDRRERELVCRAVKIQNETAGRKR